MLDKELANAQAQAKRTKAEVESALRAAADQQVRLVGCVRASAAYETHSTIAPAGANSMQPLLAPSCESDAQAPNCNQLPCPAQEHWCKQVDDLRAARDAALQGKDAAVALAVKAKEAEKAAELRTYQSQNAAAFEQLNKQCKASEAAKVKVQRGVGSSGAAASGRTWQLAACAAHPVGHAAVPDQPAASCCHQLLA